MSPVQRPRYEQLPHTADMRVRLSAPDLEALYDVGVDMLREILVGDSVVADREARTLSLPGSADANGDRFLLFLRELLYLYDAEGFIAAAVADGGSRVRGETFDAGRHRSEHQLKAVTRHGYRFEDRGDGYEVELVLDV